MIPLIDKKQTGINLRRIMDECGFTVKDVQQYLRLGSIQSVYHWLNGISMPSVDNLYALSYLFQVSVDDMLCGSRKRILTAENQVQFQKIDAAIVDSNAKNKIKTSYGDFTVAGAISLRSRLRGMDSYDGDADFEGKLQEKLNNEYNERVRFCDMKNSQLQSTAENMRLSILGRDSKGKDEKPLGVVDAYVRENTAELVDPLDVKKKLGMLEEKRNILLTELDTQIKVSNATTFIEIA